MAKKIFTDESLATFVDETKAYVDNAVSGKANSSHNHSASNITSGTLSSDRLPTVPITKGGTGATTAADALTNLGITATAAELNKMDGVTATTTELNYVDGVTSNIQTQLDGKSASGHGHDAATISTAGFMSKDDKAKLDGITASADSVSFSRDLTSGTKVGTITINGTGTDLYAPTNTTYTFATGDSNGQIKVTPSGGTAQNVSVRGLGSAAYKATSAFDSAGAASTAETNAKTYTDEKIALLMNNSSTAIDSIMELATAMEENEEVVTALEEAIGTKAKAGHTHTVSHTPAGSVSQPTFTGTKATISASYTPAGSVSQPTFTGSAVTSGAPSGTGSTSTVASSTHTHKYTPAGTVSKPTFTGSEVTSDGASNTTTVYSITAVGSLPSLSASVTNKCLTLTFGAGSLPTKGSGVSVATGAHTHKVTAAGSVSQPTFSGTEASTTSISGTTSVASSGHTHSVTAAGSVSQPTFSGTAATISASYTPAGSVSQPTFTGTAATLTSSVEK